MKIKHEWVWGRVINFEIDPEDGLVELEGVGWRVSDLAEVWGIQTLLLDISNKANVLINSLYHYKFTCLLNKH